MPETHEVDALVFGGGVAGLFTLARLCAEGYSCVLLESDALGGGSDGAGGPGQTVASQGIIHGGFKYTLGLGASRAARAIRDMPESWRDCLAGRGAVDLRGATVLSERQVLWTGPGLLASIAGAAAGLALRTGIRRVAKEELPAAFEGAPTGRGAPDVYEVDEPVLDVSSVVSAISRLHGDNAALVRWPEGVRVAKPVSGTATVEVRAGPDNWLRIGAKLIVLTAGGGNERLLPEFGFPRPVRTQRRPLHMTLIRGPAERLPELFGHCIAGLRTTPLVTVTTARDGADHVWYVGGGIAEDGVRLDREQQIVASREALRTSLPWLNLDGLRWATLRIDRSEGVPDGGVLGDRPDEPVYIEHGSVLAIWPTKLAFAPHAAAHVLARLRAIMPEPRGTMATARSMGLGPAPAAPPPWRMETLTWT